MFYKQDAFDKAYKGLASQDFKRCISNGHHLDNCVYTKVNTDGTIHHCAWGWVDQSIPADFIGGIDCLRNEKIGIAATLNGKDIEFARDLQEAHDSFKSNEIKYKMEEVAEKWNLTIPELT